MLENHIQTVSYVLSSVILVLSGDTITKEWAIPIIKNFIKDSPPLVSVFLGTVLFIGWCYFGALILGKFLFNANLIDESNVDVVAIIGFIILAIILNAKYQMGW